MIIQNTTTQIPWPIHAQWLRWMQNECIPEIMASGYFESFQFVKVLNIDDLEGPMYALQLYAVDMEAVNAFNLEMAATLAQKVQERWGESALSFTSLMEVIN